MAWSPDGRRLATVSRDRTGRVWDLAGGAGPGELFGHEGAIRFVAWSPDGRCLATGSADRTVRTWDVERGAELAIAGVHAEMVEGVAWSPEGRRIASTSRDGTVRVWSTGSSLPWLLARARARAGRELTASERRDAMLPDV